MLKKFFLNVLSSFVGAWIALAGVMIIGIFIFIGIIASIGNNSDTPSVKGHSILHLCLEGEIEETESRTQLNYMTFASGGVEKRASLRTLVNSLKTAKDNKNIDALYIECDGVSAGMATLNTLRDAVEDFKKSGKKVYAYGDYLSMGDYFVASAADSLFINPAGSMDVRGISSTILYMKSFFDKIGLSFTAVKVGTFKSAVEPYISTSMSEPARAQLDTIYGNMWQYICNKIDSSRKLGKGEFAKMVDNNIMMLKSADFVKKQKLVDGCIYEREMTEKLCRLTGKDKESLNLVSPELVGEMSLPAMSNSKNQVAVLYATGEIAENGNGGIDCAELVPEITKLAENDNVKGLVLRVNSPGGSVFGSEQIAAALKYFKSKGKPFAVSMGDYAASGGYWISADADRIFADPLTITGSIGIFGLFPNVEKMVDMLGVSPQSVSTSNNGTFPSLFYVPDASQLEQLQIYINSGYNKFINRVANGRKLSESHVRNIAEGRVWDGMKALRLKLVDELGGLDKSIKWVADKAGIGEKYNVGYYPLYEPGFWDMIIESGKTDFAQALRSRVKDAVSGQILDETLRLIRLNPIQAKMIPMRVEMR